jgi:hypothetical protein
MTKMKTKGRRLNNPEPAPGEAGACAWAKKKASIWYGFQSLRAVVSRADERPLIEHNGAQNANLEGSQPVPMRIASRSVQDLKFSRLKRES